MNILLHEATEVNILSVVSCHGKSIDFTEMLYFDSISKYLRIVAFDSI